MRRRRKSVEGSYLISGRGVSGSSISAGAAISKALTFANVIQKEGLLDAGEEVRSLYVRRIGEEAVARVDVRHNLIEVVSFASLRA